MCTPRMSPASVGVTYRCRLAGDAVEVGALAGQVVIASSPVPSISWIVCSVRKCTLVSNFSSNFKVIRHNTW
jgi:hypothetical protein